MSELTANKVTWTDTQGATLLARAAWITGFLGSHGIATSVYEGNGWCSVQLENLKMAPQIRVSLFSLLCLKAELRDVSRKNELMTRLEMVFMHGVVDALAKWPRVPVEEEDNE